jgi:hypothetical protein
MDDNFDLGRRLGRREAMSAVAGRCAAAEVAEMRDIRDKKLYLGKAADWPEFCLKHLHMSKANANRLIQHLDEFGPTYFLLTAITKVSPEAYRAIAPSIDDDKLRYNGEAIALIPENAEKVTAAVSELRKTITVKPAAPPPAPSAPEDPIRDLERECGDVAAKLERAIPMMRHRSAYMRAVVCSLRDRLNRMEMTI